MTTFKNILAVDPLPVAYSLTDSSLESDRSIGRQDVVIGEQWVVSAKIGEGCWGEVFQVKDKRTGRLYAVKREPRSPFSQIRHESIIYDILAGGPGIPQCHWYGIHDNYDCMVMDLLGADLKQLQDHVQAVPLPIVVDLGCQMVDMLEHIHDRGLVYRDIKPNNFLFAETCSFDDDELDDKHVTCQDVFDRWGEFRPKLFVVDFGLATYWRNLETKQPFPETKKPLRSRIGTARYASLNVHHGKIPARRDDMESLIYLLIELAKGSLPWTGIQARSTKVGWDRMRAIKEETSLTSLCAGLPSAFAALVEYTRHLHFLDRPNYTYMRHLLHSCLLHTPTSSPWPDVFVMDDLVNELPHIGSPPTPLVNHRPPVHPRQQKHQPQPPSSAPSHSRRPSYPKHKHPTPPLPSPAVQPHPGQTNPRPEQRKRRPSKKFNNNHRPTPSKAAKFKSSDPPAFKS
ncbi:kinase-like protein [Hesseltinella vesiculosa]|uniref:non-specific serine/threonine protein kinase n=1 Tax=Hesseltinella vesiculosa TaxID=101127 RepID=A0A1X2GU91_9FUNG|nr:kinase-like protein [Hesseltinella vesiculosa]